MKKQIAASINAVKTAFFQKTAVVNDERLLYTCGNLIRVVSRTCNTHKTFEKPDDQLGEIRAQVLYCFFLILITKNCKHSAKAGKEWLIWFENANQMSGLNYNQGFWLWLIVLYVSSSFDRQPDDLPWQGFLLWQICATQWDTRYKEFRLKISCFVHNIAHLAEKRPMLIMTGRRVLVFIPYTNQLDQLHKYSFLMSWRPRDGRFVKKNVTQQFLSSLRAVKAFCWHVRTDEQACSSMKNISNKIPSDVQITLARKVTCVYRLR